MLCCPRQIPKYSKSYEQRQEYWTTTTQRKGRVKIKKKWQKINPYLMMSTTCLPSSIKWKKYRASFKIRTNKKFSTSKILSITQSTNGNVSAKSMRTIAPFYQWRLTPIFSFLLEPKVSKFGTLKPAKSFQTSQDLIWEDSLSMLWSTQKEDSCSQLVKRTSPSGIWSH
jgi:hypothetical protein